MGLYKISSNSIIFFSKFQVFFLFYSVPKDKLQIAIAAELYRRGWRYHTEYKIWVARLPNINPEMRHENFEQGEYQYFNKDTWSREKKIIYLEYAKLDNKPSLRKELSLSQKYPVS